MRPARSRAPRRAAVPAPHAIADRSSPRSTGSPRGTHNVEPKLMSSLSHTDCRMSAASGECNCTALSSAAILSEATSSVSPTTSMLRPFAVVHHDPRLHQVVGGIHHAADHARRIDCACKHAVSIEPRQVRRPRARRDRPCAYHQGIPFCTKTNTVDESERNAAAPANAASAVALVVTENDILRAEILRTVARSHSPCDGARALAQREALFPDRPPGLAPRASTETSRPPAASFAARCPPIAPAPNTQIRRSSIFASDFTFGVISPPLDSSMSSAGLVLEL